MSTAKYTRWASLIASETDDSQTKITIPFQGRFFANDAP